MTSDSERERLRRELDEQERPGWASKTACLALNCLSGAIPFAGGVLRGASAVWGAHEQDRVNKLFADWLKLHEVELREIAITMMESIARGNVDDEQVRQRVE